MKTVWRIRDDKNYEHGIRLTADNVVCWTNIAGTPAGEVGEYISFDDFVSGRLHQWIEDTFGDGILDEILAAVKQRRDEKTEGK